MLKTHILTRVWKLDLPECTFSVVGEDVTINGCLEHDVLLPCACSGRNESREVRWQTEDTEVSNGSVVFKHTQTAEAFNDKYKDRGKSFLSENRENCSILLTNITAKDQRKYRCIFNIDERYQRPFVTLNIYGKSLIHFANQPISYLTH